MIPAALRRAGLPLGRVPPPFPQPERVESGGLATRSLRPLEVPVARALPGARKRLRVGVDCRIEGKALVTSTLACLPPREKLRDGAGVPAWWFSAYEVLGGGTPWNDGFEDNGTYYVTTSERGRVEVSEILKTDELVVYGSRLGGPLVARVSFFVPPSADSIDALLRARTRARAIWLWDRFRW